MMAELGLRERKKAATRAALSHAAWSMMLERGLEAVTPESVAAAADVSARTFRNYFASREEAILGELVERHIALVETIRARPAGETAWDSLVHVLPLGVTAIVGERDDFVVLAAAITKSPAMLAQNLVVAERGREVLTAVLAERTGTDPDRDVAPRLLAGVAGAAINAAIDVWIRDGQAALPDLIRDCLAQLRAGLPVGAAAPAT